MPGIHDENNQCGLGSDQQSGKSEKVSDSIGVLVQRGGVAHFRDIFLTIVSQSKASKSLTRKQKLIYGSGLILFTITIGFLGWTSVQRFNQSLAEKNLILNRSVGEISNPELLPVARKIILQADKMLENREYEKAASYYRKVIDYSISLYQHETKQTEITLLPTCLDKQNRYLESHEILCESQGKLVSMIEEIYFPKLIEQLKNNKIGEIVGQHGKDFREIFTEGALRTTYGILVREVGIWADEGDDDGFINSRREALKLPCSLLSSIERLWQDHINSSCGWYDSRTKSVNLSPGCSQLDGYTLTDSIFLSDYQPVINRLKECKVIPLDATQSY